MPAKYSISLKAKSACTIGQQGGEQAQLRSPQRAVLCVPVQQCVELVQLRLRALPVVQIQPRNQIAFDRGGQIE